MCSLEMTLFQALVEQFRPRDWLDCAVLVELAGQPDEENMPALALREIGDNKRYYSRLQERCASPMI